VIWPISLSEELDTQRRSVGDDVEDRAQIGVLFFALRELVPIAREQRQEDGFLPHATGPADISALAE